MAEPGIVLDGVYKKFRRGELHDSLRDLIPAMVRKVKPGRAAVVAEQQKRLTGEEFWAVEDLSFTVKAGDALGIIGGNGAGKSTTLKIINGILRPNRGTCTVTGRMGALIEIAAGFHQDLTGRENVFLQGAIMGMSKQLIMQRFDDIVEFAGMGTFIDTPVKRYSSGMNARLGFAIAAHLNPDVLIIDEVLSVGDFRFQQRAYDRVRDLIRSGIPVVVVSHQLDRIATLCTRALVLRNGRMVFDGPASDAVTAYLGDIGTDADITTVGDISLETFTADRTADIAPGDPVTLRITGAIARTTSTETSYSVGVRISSTQDGHVVSTVSTSRAGLPLAAGPFAIDMLVDMNVPPGVYRCDAFSWDTVADCEIGITSSLFLQVRQAAGVHGGVTFLRPRVRVSKPTSDPESRSRASAEAVGCPA
ncbi:MAG TPA: ABC transporter ATP-binding protein [Gemmatirosa sp.]